MHSSFFRTSTSLRISGRRYSKSHFTKLSKHNPDDGKALHSVNDHVVEKTPITAQLWQMRKEAAMEDSHCDVYRRAGGLPQRELLTKTTRDARLVMTYKFTSDNSLRDLYVDHSGDILIGKLLEDLDALAGNIANDHCDDKDPSTARLQLVTASVDEIIQRRSITTKHDLILVGQVAWVGRSSLDVVIEVHDASMLPKSADGNMEGRVSSTEVSSDSDNISDETTLPILVQDSPSRLLSSYFTYVARNKDTGRAAAVNKLELSSPLETSVFERRQAIAIARKSNSPAGIEKQLACSDKIRALVEAGSAMEDMPAIAHPNAVLMRYTGLENSVICQPQNVNTSGRVFGGFIMHRAYDLAVATAYIFAGTDPVFLEVDKIHFRRPVDIGDLLRLKSRVIFAAESDPVRPVVVVEVKCQVVRPERASSFVSNTFHFVFAFPSSQVSLRKVLPCTAEEATALLRGSQWLRDNEME